MKELIEALQALFDDSALASTLNGLWFWVVPQGTELPYAVLTTGNVTVDYTMGASTDRAETIPVTITAWLGVDTYTDLQPAEWLLDTYEDLAAVFDDCALTMHDWELVRCERTGYALESDPDGGWAVRVNYTILIEEK